MISDEQEQVEADSRRPGHAEPKKKNDSKKTTRTEIDDSKKTTRTEPDDSKKTTRTEPDESLKFQEEF